MRVLAELEVAGLDLIHLCLEGRWDEAATIGAEEAVGVGVGGEVGLGFGFHGGEFKVEVGCTLRKRRGGICLLLLNCNWGLAYSNTSRFPPSERSSEGL